MNQLTRRLNEHLNFERWDAILSSSYFFDKICALSEQTRKELCQPSKYYYFIDGLIDILNKAENKKIVLTSDDKKIINKLAMSILSDELITFRYNNSAEHR
jgi:hypothetical protein